ncbi:hemin receptor [Meridianimarinicoccus roseus]|jgi:nitric oxide dioxygenase|uniref:Hemin receptor n=1 Tax=Meridianimarinicoccus roseus TaxID=2072018 RepID=A0A2V2L782_9RHOB|nr:globin family protein [Meridianimarinicoccus roseus]PWR01202.1 hemin receptor [Meridianimarinicoccus roseus]
MNDTQIALIQDSFAKVVPIKDAAAELFYSDLFETAPEVKPYFAGSNMKDQGAKLMATLGVVVNGLRDLDKIVPVAQQLAVRHVGYGVKAEDYDKVGASLLRTLEKGLGDAFTPEVKEAWTAAYTTLAGVMCEAAYPAKPTGLRGFIAKVFPGTGPKVQQA